MGTPDIVMCANNTDIAPLWPLKVSRGQGRAGEAFINNSGIHNNKYKHWRVKQRAIVVCYLNDAYSLLDVYFVMDIT